MTKNNSFMQFIKKHQLPRFSVAEKRQLTNYLDIAIKPHPFRPPPRKKYRPELYVSDKPKPKWRVRVVKDGGVMLEFYRAGGVYQGFTVANAGNARWMRKMLLLAMRDLAKENEYQAKDTHE